MHGILEKNPSHIRPGSYPGRPTMGIRLGPKKVPVFTGSMDWFCWEILQENPYLSHFLNGKITLVSG